MWGVYFSVAGPQQEQKMLLILFDLDLVPLGRIDIRAVGADGEADRKEGRRVEELGCGSR